MIKQPRYTKTNKNTIKLLKKAIKVYLDLTEVNEKLNDSWAVAKNYENILDCMWLRDKQNIDINKALNVSEKAIEGFAISNSLNTLFVVLDKIAK